MFIEVIEVAAGSKSWFDYYLVPLGLANPFDETDNEILLRAVLENPEQFDPSQDRPAQRGCQLPSSSVLL